VPLDRSHYERRDAMAFEMAERGDREARDAILRIIQRDHPGRARILDKRGGSGQLHLIGGEQPSPLAKGPGKDPATPHVALAVANVSEAKAELERSGTPYWSLTGIAGPQAEQLFLKDPNGNIIELHQVDQCRCRGANRK
jgi:hypothetical protein